LPIIVAAAGIGVKLGLIDAAEAATLAVTGSM